MMIPTRTTDRPLATLVYLCACLSFFPTTHASEGPQDIAKSYNNIQNEKINLSTSTPLALEIAIKTVPIGLLFVPPLGPA